MDITQAIFPLIIAGDLSGVSALLDLHPGVVHSRQTDSELHLSPLQLATAFEHAEKRDLKRIITVLRSAGA